MTDSAASAGFSSSLFYDATPGQAAASITTELAEVVNISGPNIDGDDIDITHMESSSGFREFLPGLTDPGEISLDLNFVKAQTTALYTTIEMRTMASFKVSFSDGSTWHGDGYIKAIGHETPLDDKISVTVTIKCAQKWYFTAAA